MPFQPIGFSFLPNESSNPWAHHPGGNQRNCATAKMHNTGTRKIHICGTKIGGIDANPLVEPTLFRPTPMGQNGINNGCEGKGELLIRFWYKRKIFRHIYLA
jgi:hypothetical protein